VYVISVVIQTVVVGALDLLWNHRAGHVEAAETVLASVTCGITLSMLQVFGIFSRLQFRWPAPVLYVLTAFDRFLDFLVMRPDCLFGNSYSTDYIASALIPMHFVVVLLLWNTIARALHKSTKGRFPYSDSYQLLNTLGMIFLSLHITIVVWVSSAFDTYASKGSRNDMSGHVLRHHPQVRFVGPEWTQLLPVYVAAVLLYLLALPAIWLYMIYVAPTHWNKSWFRVKSRFLFFKFQPDRFWYNIIIILRSLAFALVPVLSSSGHLQFLMFEVLLTTGLAMHMVYMPYLDDFANNLEFLELILLSLILVAGALFLDEKNVANDTDGLGLILTYVILTLMMIGGLAVIGVFTFAITRATFPQRSSRRKLKHIDDLSTRISAVSSIITRNHAHSQDYQQHLLTSLRSISYNDCRRVRGALDIICQEVMGMPSESWWRTRLSENRLEDATASRTSTLARLAFDRTSLEFDRASLRTITFASPRSSIYSSPRYSI
jgi:hypothetical protein